MEFLGRLVVSRANCYSVPEDKPVTFNLRVRELVFVYAVYERLCVVHRRLCVRARAPAFCALDTCADCARVKMRIYVITMSPCGHPS